MMSRGADWLLTLWIVFVGAAYFGGFYFPAIGEKTWSLRFVYFAMLAISLIYQILNYFRSKRTSDRKGGRR